MSKGRLTNLCREDKGRIGELIRTLASERQQRMEVQEGSDKWEKQAVSIKTKFNKSLKLIALYQQELKRVRQQSQPPSTQCPHQPASSSSCPASASPKKHSATSPGGQPKSPAEKCNSCSPSRKCPHTCTALVSTNPTVETLVQTDPVLEPIGVQTDPVVFGARGSRRTPRERSPSPGIPLPRGDRGRERSSSSRRIQPVRDPDSESPSPRRETHKRGGKPLKPPQMALLQRYLKIQNEKRPIPGSPPTFGVCTDPEISDVDRGLWSLPSSNDFLKRTPGFGRKSAWSSSADEQRPIFEESSRRESPRRLRESPRKRRESPRRRESPGLTSGRLSPRELESPQRPRRHSVDDIRRDRREPDVSAGSRGDRHNVYAFDDNMRGGRAQYQGYSSSLQSSDGTTVFNAASPLRYNTSSQRFRSGTGTDEDHPSSPLRPSRGDFTSSSDQHTSSRDADDERSAGPRTRSTDLRGAHAAAQQQYRDAHRWLAKRETPLTPVAEFPESTVDTEHPSVAASACALQDKAAEQAPMGPQGRGWSYCRGNAASSSEEREISSIAESQELFPAFEKKGVLLSNQQADRNPGGDSDEASKVPSSLKQRAAVRSRDVHVSWDVDTSARDGRKKDPSPGFVLCSREPSPYMARISQASQAESNAGSIPMMSPHQPCVEPNAMENDAVLQASPAIRNSTNGLHVDDKQSNLFLSDGFYEKSMFSVIDSFEEDAQSQMRSLDDQLRRIEERVYSMVPEQPNSTCSSAPFPLATGRYNHVRRSDQSYRESPRVPVAPHRRTSPHARISRDEQRVRQEDLHMSMRASGLRSPALEEVDHVLQLLESH